MRMSREEVGNICKSSVYWAVEMRQQLVKHLEENQKVKYALEVFSSQWELWDLVREPESKSFVVAGFTLQALADEIHLLDESELACERALFSVLEDVGFFVGELSSAFENVCKIVSMCGYEGAEQTELVNYIGADMGGFTIE